MSVSLHVVGFRAPDDLWQKHLAVWQACTAADVDVPEETVRFFDYEDPTGKPGIEIELGNAAEPFDALGEGGFQIDVTKLPPDLRYIRAYQAW